MTPWLDVVIRTTAMLAAGLLFDLALRSRAAALRHFVLAASVAAAFAVVPLSLVVPAWDVPLEARWDTAAVLAPKAPARSVSAAAAADPATAAVRAAETPLSASDSPIAGVLWFAGSACAAASLLAGVFRLRAIVRRGRPAANAEWNALAAEVAASYDIRRAVSLIETDAADLVATWGLHRPSVLLPAHAREWSRDRMHAVLSHELAHVRRYDWAVQIGAEAMRTVLWFNPLIWIVCTRLRRAAEQACDDAVLGRGIAARDYAAHLLALARRCRPSRTGWVSAMPMAHPSTLERRIVAMLNPRLNRQALSRGAAVLAAALLLAVALPVAALRAKQAPPTYFSGAVYDPTGAVIPGVTLSLEDATQKKTAQTGADGRFQIAGVTAGKYVLSATLPGFRALRQEFELKDARDWDRAITLQVGTLQETISVRSTRITAPATATRPQPAAPVRVGGNIRVPCKLVDVKPVYPDSMRAAGREGTVNLDAVIAEDGTVTSVRVITGDAHPDLAIAAADAVRQWRFSPTLLNGRAIEVVMTVKVGFSLD
jgi:TonB family protein